MPSLTPLASLYAPIAARGRHGRVVCGRSSSSTGWRNGFAGDQPAGRDDAMTDEFDTSL